VASRTLRETTDTIVVTDEGRDESCTFTPHHWTVVIGAPGSVDAPEIISLWGETGNGSLGQIKITTALLTEPPQLPKSHPVEHGLPRSWGEDAGNAVSHGVPVFYGWTEKTWDYTSPNSAGIPSHKIVNAELAWDESN